MGPKDSAPPGNAQRLRYRFTLRQLFSLVTGMALACAAWASVAHVGMRASPGMAALSRLCGVASVGLIVGAIVGRPLRALIGALVGLGVAYAACGVFIAGTQMFRMGDAEDLIPPLLFASLIPAAVAAAKRRRAGLVISFGFVPALVFLFVASSIFYFNVLSPPVPGAPPTAYEGRGMVVALAIVALLPGTLVAVCSWMVARGFLVGLDFAADQIGWVAKRE